jgi:hypothetical protein
MLERCIGMGLEMPLTPADVDGVFRLRDKERQKLDSTPGMCSFLFVRRQKTGKY